MYKKLCILLIFSKLKAAKLLIDKYRMHNLYAIFAKILNICKQVAGNLVNESGNVPRKVVVPRFSDLEIVSLWSNLWLGNRQVRVCWFHSLWINGSNVWVRTHPFFCSVYLSQYFTVGFCKDKTYYLKINSFFMMVCFIFVTKLI